MKSINKIAIIVVPRELMIFKFSDQTWFPITLYDSAGERFPYQNGRV